MRELRTVSAKLSKANRKPLIVELPHYATPLDTEKHLETLINVAARQHANFARCMLDSVRRSGLAIYSRIDALRQATDHTD